MKMSDKKWKYRKGETPLCVIETGREDVPLASVTKNFDLVAHDADGRIKWTTCAMQFDLIEVKPWADWPIDKPVMYRHRHNSTWLRGYWAGERGEFPCVFAEGRTSWTIGVGVSGHLLCAEVREPTDEELRGSAS